MSAYLFAAIIVLAFDIAIVLGIMLAHRRARHRRGRRHTDR